ncbi:MAG: glycosyltransferase, partial [Romboutsia sp.]|uniref:glycosyltransferase n=1 Tax=Romboutsia sp. TaxID=1965302 RepID=UPI003F3B2480
SNTKNEIINLVNYCKSKKIPTVFWCKEDPPQYETFKKTASLFDYIFTTDENCVQKYKTDFSTDKVYPLMFGIQPKLHNPIRNPQQKKLNTVCFAGIYYSSKFEDRQRSFNELAEASLEYGLDIYDRFSYVKDNDNYKYPDKFKDCLNPYVNYLELIELYKRYDVSINLNTVTNSNTMFSRRIYDCLACGTTVLSNYSLGAKNKFADVIGICNDKGEAHAFLEKTLNDKIYKNKLEAKGIIKVAKENKYSDRIKTICEIIGIDLKKGTDKKVSVIVCTNRPQNMKRMFENYSKQTHKEKELIIVLNNDNMNLREWKKEAKKYKDEDIKIFKLDSKLPLGKCLNFAIDESRYDYIFKMDDDDVYSENCLENELVFFDYTDASIIGKNSFYVYFKDTKKIAIRYPDREYIYTKLIAGSCMLFTRKVYEDTRFSDEINVGEIGDFLKRAIQKGYKVFSSNRFGHAVIRNDDLDNHTWKENEEHYLTRCSLVNENFEYEYLEKLIDIDYECSESMDNSEMR